MGFDVSSWSRSGLGRKGAAARRLGPAAAVGPVTSVLGGAAATVFSAGSEALGVSPCVRPAASSVRVRKPKGSTGAVGDESDGCFSSTPDRETAESDANVALDCDVARTGESSGATAVVRIPLVGNVRFGERSGFTWASDGSNCGCPLGAAVVNDSFEVCSSLPRWPQAIAKIPSDRTVANADIPRTMRFMGRNPDEPVAGGIAGLPTLGRGYYQNPPAEERAVQPRPTGKVENGELRRLRWSRKSSHWLAPKALLSVSRSDKRVC